MDGGSDSNDSFLPLAEAASRLGLSRLKLREGIAKGVIPARRDNQGHWRVDLAALPASPKSAIAAAPALPADLMAVLFDEIEELSADLDSANSLTERLATLAGAQADTLDRVTAALEARTEERDRLGTIAGRALAAADEAETRAARLQQTTDRAMALLDRAAGAIEGVQAEMARIKADAAQKDAMIAGHGVQLDRLFTLSEQALEKAAAARRAPGLIARVFGTSRK
jgi:excisionase family DNA binding protein